MSLHHSESEAYRLLSAMIEHELVTPKRDMWSLFVPSVTQPITESVQLLGQILTSCDIPEQYVPGITMSGQTGATKFPLRKMLIDWLLRSREDEGESSRSFRLDPYWTAKALVALTFSDPSSSIVCQRQTKSHENELEQLYMETCLELPLGGAGAGAREQVTSGDIVPHIAVLLHTVENVVKQEVQYWCSRSDKQVC